MVFNNTYDNNCSIGVNFALSVYYHSSGDVIIVLSVNYHPSSGVISALSVNYYPSVGNNFPPVASAPKKGTENAAANFNLSESS